jgi:hypothetical protein
VIEQQPAFRGLNRERPGANLGTLPTALDAHYKTVSTPMNQVGASAEVNVAERCVSVVARAAEQEILAVDLSREEYSFAGLPTRFSSDLLHRKRELICCIALFCFVVNC